MPPLRYHLQLKRTLLWMIGLAALSGTLCFVPLLNVLGYEFSLVLAAAISFAGAHVGTLVVATTRSSATSLVLGTDVAWHVIFRLLRRSVGLTWGLLVVPLAFVSLNALRVRNCNLTHGLAMFLLLPVCSAGIAASMGTLWGLLVPRPRLATAAALLTIVCSLAWGIYRIYDTPPICAYDPFIGYFAGPIYDEAITIEPALVWARLYHVCWLLAFVLGATLVVDPVQLRIRAASLRLSRNIVVTLGITLVTAFLLTLEGANLGFHVTAHYISEQLGAVRRTEHFDIVYPREWPIQRAEQLAEDHEFRFAQLAALFQSTPTRVRSYVFRSAAEKRRLIGAGRVLIAKPWRAEIFLNDASFPHPVLKHELAHVFARRFGDRLLGLSIAWRASAVGLPYPRVNIGLIEGIAVATDWSPYGEMTGHQQAAALVRLGLAPPLERLLGLGFFTHAGNRSYALAGAFCRYLLEQHGMTKLLETYHTAGDFARIYRHSLPTLVKQWKAWLAGVEVPSKQLQIAKEQFRRPAIFKRVCAHEIARLTDTARHLVSTGQAEQATRALDQICRLDPSDPGHLLAYMDAVAASRGPDEALRLKDRLLGDRLLGKPMRRAALERIGDLQWLSGGPDAASTARAAYERAARLAAGPSARRLLDLKRLALRWRDPERTLLLSYLVRTVGETPNPISDMYIVHRLSLLVPASGVGPYLIAKQLIAQEFWQEAAGPLQQALDLGLPGPDFVVEAERLLAISYYRQGDLPAAKRAFRRLRDLPQVAAGVRLLADDWLERVRWRHTGSVRDRR